MSTAELLPSARLGNVVRSGVLLSAAGLLAAVALEQGGTAEAETIALGGTWLTTAVVAVAAAACAARAALVRVERSAWTLLTGALVAFAAGNVYWATRLEPLAERPFPSLADALWLSVYPLALVALAVIARNRLDGSRTAIWLDAVLGGTALAAAWVAVAFGSILADLDAASPLERVTLLAYPAGDLLLIALAVGVFALAEWSPGPSWLLLAGGFLLFAAADTIRIAMIAHGELETSLSLAALWPLGLLAVGLAAWLPGDRRPARVDSSRGLVIPALATTGALAVLLYGSLGTVNETATLLAALAVVAAIVRASFTLGEVRSLAESRIEAVTDDLTGLGNRRRLMRDLEETLGAGEPHTLFLFDLDGFKAYNDRFGHVQGDLLLSRLGSSLAMSVERDGGAYRLGGDEFCVLAPGRDRTAERAANLRAALSESGRGFEIGCASGWAVLPAEAGEPSSALRLADSRLYAVKNGRPGAAKRQAADVALGILTEYQPALEPHIDAVTALAAIVGRRLELSRDELDDLASAAELHDIGKIAIPTSILEKPGPLDDEEWLHIRRHTLVGERMLAAAPSLEHVARIVRCTHERFDGTGYPDGLAGEAIPIAARVICVCDAFDAMTSQRAYREIRSVDEAVAELRRCAGRQFDPAVVECFVECLSRGEASRRLLRRAS